MAGRGRGRAMLPTIAATFAAHGVKLDVQVTPAPGEAARLAGDAASEGYAVVVAVGGDGTANECANGLMGAETALALFPLGTGNDLARNLGYPRRRREVPAFLAKGARQRRIDVGEANGRVFVNHVGVGIDGVVAASAARYARVLGPFAGYALASLVAIARYQPTPMQVSVDGAREEGSYLIVLASNGVHFGGGMRAAPGADMSDGALDVTIAGALDRSGALATLARLYRGKHVDGQRVRGVRAQRLEVTFERAVPMELDGEPSRVRGLSVAIRPSSLTVLA
ncbi:MAG: diacylglycerol kinase family lipid kinase [Chloroflexi bacterium]|nr:diacylglycerol kinase family lipid kinase [Chloroflexota bacterium]